MAYLIFIENFLTIILINQKINDSTGQEFDDLLWYTLQNKRNKTNMSPSPHQKFIDSENRKIGKHTTAPIFEDENQGAKDESNPDGLFDEQEDDSKTETERGDGLD